MQTLMKCHIMRHFIWAITRQVYIKSRICVVKDVVKCSYEHLCVVHRDTCCQHNVGVGEGTIKKIAEEYFGSATLRKKIPLVKKKKNT